MKQQLEKTLASTQQQLKETLQEYTQQKRLWSDKVNNFKTKQSSSFFCLF
jgi:hypothetical protein